jgi:PEP-CTERM motif
LAVGIVHFAQKNQSFRFPFITPPSKNAIVLNKYVLLAPGRRQRNPRKQHILNMNPTRNLLVLTFLSGITAPGAFAAFNTLHAYGDAAGTTPPPSFTGDGSGTTTITAGGADFWGDSDAGAFLWDNTGTYTTTGDFTATVRHVSTTTPAPEWGRDGIIARALAGGAVANTPQANDPNFMAIRKSNGQIDAGIRALRGTGGTTEDLTSGNPGIAGPGVAANSAFLGMGRSGNAMRVSTAMNLGTEATPVLGRWVQYGEHTTAAAFNGGNQVVVGLAHQSHPQTISPDTNDVNTATFSSWNFTGSYNAARFGPAAGTGPAATAWTVQGAINVNPIGGAIRGRSFVQVGGVATGEANKWTILAGRKDTFVPAFGAAGAVKRAVASEVADLVQPSRFRRTAALPGLTADIYFGANAGTLAGARAIIDAATPPAGTAIIPNVNWTGGSDADTNYGGLTGADSFLVATQPGNPDPASGAAGNFSGNQENYGVHMQGQIFIPGDADRKGHFNNVVLFRDGIDDFTYLNIDGQELLNDNDWTGYNGLDNGGSHVTAMNVSNAKFDDGEWVSFEMIMWEGGGGDNGALYSDMDDTNNSFRGLAPGTYSTAVNATGSAQVGTEAADGSFAGAPLPNGQWDVFLTVQNTGTSANFFQAVTVVPEPTAPLLVGLGALGAFLRRRRSR